MRRRTDRGQRLQDRITLIRKNSKKVRLPERCDVLATETLSAFCFDAENSIEFVADAASVLEARRAHYPGIRTRF